MSEEQKPGAPASVADERPRYEAICPKCHETWTKAAIGTLCGLCESEHCGVIESLEEWGKHQRPLPPAASDERAAFEAWFESVAQGKPSLRRDHDGRYLDSRTDAAWQAWQAARAQPVASVEAQGAVAMAYMGVDPERMDETHLIFVGEARREGFKYRPLVFADAPAAPGPATGAAVAWVSAAQLEELHDGIVDSVPLWRDGKAPHDIALVAAAPTIATPPEATDDEPLTFDDAIAWVEAAADVRPDGEGKAAILNTLGILRANRERYTPPEVAPTDDARAAYRKANPLGGPAVIFDSIADHIRAGDSVERAMALFDVRFVKGDDARAAGWNDAIEAAAKECEFAATSVLEGERMQGAAKTCARRIRALAASPGASPEGPADTEGGS
jgi:hypothetical protein